MSIHTRYQIKCDTCGMEYSQEAPTASAARRLAKKTGWSRRMGADTTLVDVGPVCRGSERRRAEEESARRELKR